MKGNNAAIPKIGRSIEQRLLKEREKKISRSFRLGRSEDRPVPKAGQSNCKMVKRIFLTLALTVLARTLQAALDNYENGTAALVALAQKGTTVVIFFATCCPNCIMTLTELSQNWDKIDPSITRVVADYDVERDLKAAFGVTYQDTFVLLDQAGTAKTLWNAGGIEGLHKNALVKWARFSLLSPLW